MFALALALAVGAQQSGALSSSSFGVVGGPAVPAGPAIRQQRTQRDSLHALADSLRAAGQLADARRIAERLQDRYPDDPGVLILLGRIHLAWPVIGRYQAESLFARAASLAPTDPEPRYYLGQVGLALGGDDGEQIARRGLVPALSIDPSYRDAWDLWLRLYRGERERRDMLAALNPHRGSWVVDQRRAQLLLELRRFDDAAALYDSLSARRPWDVAARAGLARSLFAAGRDSAGAAAYAGALELASLDSADILWQQVRNIATPAEQAAYAATPTVRRAAFLRVFWARRDPDLTQAGNARLGEHFRRLAEAQRRFTLLHPNSRYFRSSLFRNLSLGFTGHPGGFEGAAQHALRAQCQARLPGIRDEQAQRGEVTVPEPDGPPLNLDDGLDDRGRIYLRQGAPDYISIGSNADETWCYFRPDGTTLRVTFVRRTGVWGATGDMMVTPLVYGEAQSAAELLTSDRFSTASDLTFAFWPAAFRAADQRNTQLLVVPDSMHTVATLIDEDGREVARDSATGRTLRLTGPPGHYLLLVDGDRGAHTGRYRGTVSLPDFGGDAPAVSSLFVASGTVPASLDSLAARAPEGLRLVASRPLRVYAEVYHLGRVDGLSRYRAEYRFERLDGFVLRRGRERSYTVGFDRVGAFAPRTVESLIVDPDRLPQGKYRLHLVIHDLILGVEASSSTLEFELH